MSLTEASLNEKIINESANIIDLSNQNLEKIPFKIPDNNSIFTLFLSHNKITEIPNNLMKINNIILSFNEYHEIPPKIISTIITFNMLKCVDFSYNNIQKIPEEFFKLQSLKKLKFFHNKIISFPKILNETISNIDIGYNLLQEIPANFPNLVAFHADHNCIKQLNFSFNSITKLCLSKNEITSISADLIFPELVILDLSYNRIKELPDFRTFSPKLKTINASFNFIEKFPHFSNETLTIYLHHNSISDIENFMTSSAVFADLSYNEITELLDLPPFIVNLNLRHNKIKKINPINSENIKTIDFSDNLIENIPYINCYEMKFPFNRTFSISQVSHRITFLDVSKSNLKEIPTDIFMIPIILTILAPFNQIKSIPTNISGSTLRKLDLSFNPIETFSQLPKNIEHLILNNCELRAFPSFLSEYKELIEISFAGNKIESIENFIPKQIQHLNLSNNKINDFSVSNKIFRDLKFLDLSFNSIKNFQNLFFNIKLPTLFFLDLSFNPIEQSSFKIDGLEPFSLIPKLRRLVLNGIKLNEEINFSIFRNLCYLDLSNSLLIPKFEKVNQKVKFISVENSKENVSYSNKLGTTETHENYILILNEEKTSFYGIFSNFEFMTQKVVPVINGRQKTNDFSFIKNFVSDVYSPFALIIDEFKIEKKFWAVFCGNFAAFSICNDGSMVKLLENEKVQEIYDEMEPSAIELNLPENAKFLILTEFKTLQTISCELIENLAMMAKSASQMAYLLKTAISSFDQFHNFSVIVIDCVNYK